MFTKQTKEGEAAPMANSQMTKSNESSRAQVTSRGNAGRAMASIVGGDMVLEGSIKTEGSLQIDGKVKGNITAGDITVGASGSIEGEVHAEMITVKGRIKGSVRARKVEMESGAHVEGDVVHASLQIQPNAVFEGQVKHSKDPLKPEATTAAISGPTPPSQNPTPPSKS